MADTLVLGAGITGVCAALALQSRGHAVTLIDRKAPGQETSFGNACLIQAEAMEPYPMPLAARDLWAIVTGRSNDVRWTLRGLWAQAGPLASYARHSLPRNHARAIATYRRLIPDACSAHAPLIEAAGAGDLIRRDGYLELYRSPRGCEAGQAMARRFQDDHGARATLLDGQGLRALEPSIIADLPGAVHWPDVWAVTDPADLTARYAALFRARGGHILQADAMGLHRRGAGWRLAGTTAQHAVVSLGPWSAPILARHGLRLPLLLKRGYHRHLHPAALPRRPLCDVENGIMLSPTRTGLRLCTGADLSARVDPDPPQLRRGQAAASALLGPPERVEQRIWTGRRPCMPDMLPVVGAVPGQPGLWAHTGHGHHGLTLAAVTANLLADAMEGGDPMTELSPARLA